MDNVKEIQSVKLSMATTQKWPSSLQKKMGNGGANGGQNGKKKKTKPFFH